MVSSNIIQRVLFVRYRDNVGTGFTIEKEDKQYLVSAKHVFPGLTQPDEISVFKDGDWRKITVDPLFCKDNDIDIVAFDIGDKIITPNNEVQIGTGGDFFASQDAYFLGFPYGLSTDSGEINNKYPFPFIKKCIISAFNKQTIYLDGHNNRGFSGGPVVTVDSGNAIKIIGVVSGFLGDDQNKTENSGIFYANRISFITEVM